MLKDDHAKYMSVASSGEDIAFDLTYGNNGNDGRPYNLKFKLKEDLVAPSYQAAMESFVNTFKDVKVKDISSYTGMNDQKAKEFVKNFSKLNLEEARIKAYKTFSMSLMKDSKARQIFFDDLSRKGYNAVVDENDADFAQSPMIVFKANKSLSKASSQKFSQKDADYLRQLYWGENEYADVKTIKSKTKLKF